MKVLFILSFRLLYFSIYIYKIYPLVRIHLQQQKNYLTRWGW